MCNKKIWILIKVLETVGRNETLGEYQESATIFSQENQKDWKVAYAYE